ncbi:MAG: hypothetical protein AB1758_27825, partial [Candidatus Eremiobacterota bacterium]
TDASGNVSASYDYDEWGGTERETGSVYNPFRYTGQQFDGDTGPVLPAGPVLRPDDGAVHHPGSHRVCGREQRLRLLWERPG